jgi:fused signal recognition particle receptor
MRIFGFGEKKEKAAQPVPASASRYYPLAATPEAPVLAEESAKEEGGRLWRLRQALKKSSSRLTEGVAQAFTHRRADDDTLQELEDLLVMADLGAKTAAEIREKLAKARFDKESAPQEALAFLAEELERALKPCERDFVGDGEIKPYVVLFSGVNGSGKTTTVGKIAFHAARSGRKAVVAACDTFRAAAVEQLEVWAARAGADFVKGEHGADPAGVAYRAVEQARRTGADLVLIDTAGRLQNKQHLMEELKKTLRVLKKLDPAYPHDSVLVLDATTGGNALSQIEHFREAAGLTGLVMTKLDGTAKGGILVNAARTYGLPIYAIGVGERMEDLLAFRAAEFAKRLAGIEEE